MKNSFFIGTAGWNIPKENRGSFAIDDTASLLCAYAQVFNCVEINSSFHREHRPQTYARWAESVPSHFRFSIKLSKIFTHVQKLEVDEVELQRILDGILNLKEKLGCLLVQMPPKLEFKAKIAERFFASLRELLSAPIVVEARHPSWEGARALFKEHGLVQVEADPELIKAFSKHAAIRYLRWHGSPEIYKSSYTHQLLSELSDSLAADSRECWIVFDNTARGAATPNALFLQSELRAKQLKIRKN